jgi:XTP/dITP diphosphohydrolase
MKKIVFATNNSHKLSEIQGILKNQFEVLSLKDIGFNEDIPETGITLSENASQKSYAIFNRFKIDCFSDDTGLEVDALDGRPGVYSARYAGEGCSFDDNVNKILSELYGNENRQAAFSTVISLIKDGKEYQFEGRIEGEITEVKYGNGGFGYDPVFKPAGYDITFAEMDANTKNLISHRALATKKLVSFLNAHY